MISPNAHLRTISAYTPGASPEQIKAQYGLDHVEKLASNENPLGASPSATAAAIAALSTVGLYQDGGQELRARLATFHGVTPEHISLGNGSDAIIHQVMRVFLHPGRTALSSEGSFVSFRIAVKGANRDFQLVPMLPEYRYDVRALADAIDSTTQIVYIANPNNPTGTYITHDELVWLMDRVPEDVLVVLDEAYVEYARHIAPETYPAESFTRPNLIRLRTFSKAYGLAALRIGYAFGNPDVIQWLHRTKLPFDPNGVGCAAAIAAIDDQAFVEQTVTLNASSLDLLHSIVREAGYTCSTSVANFIMIDLHDQPRAEQFHLELLHHGFISRPLVGFGLPTCVRISTGTAAQMERLAQVLRACAERFATPHTSTLE